MAFLIRQVSITADGRRIVREKRVDAESISIGRAPENDVHLPDLAVSLHETRLSAEDAQPGRELRFGGYRILLDREAGDMVLTVEPVADAEGAADDRAFGLGWVMPGKRAMAWAGALLVLLACLAWPIASHLSAERSPKPVPGFHGDRLWLSGGMSRGHAQLVQNCKACHVDAFVQVRDESCTACHKTVHDHAPALRLAAVGGQDSCAGCHIEHEGRVPLAPDEQKMCADCHGDLARALPDTKLRDASDFGDHHPQFRPTVRLADGALQRVSLDARPTEHSGLGFSHALHLSRSNGVARMAQTLKADHGFGDALDCANCHVPTPDGAGFRPIEMERDCQMCHSLAFAERGRVVRMMRHGDAAQALAELRDFYTLNPAAHPSFGRRKPGTFDFRATAPGSQRASRAIGKVCTECHAIDTPHPVRLSRRYFMLGGFDHADHKTESCTSCHAAPRSRSATDVLLPDVGSCRSCHGGENSGSKVPSSCAMCHDYHVMPVTAQRPGPDKG